MQCCCSWNTITLRIVKLSRISNNNTLTEALFRKFFKKFWTIILFLDENFSLLLYWSYVWLLKIFTLVEKCWSITEKNCRLRKLIVDYIGKNLLLIFILFAIRNSCKFHLLVLWVFCNRNNVEYHVLFACIKQLLNVNLENGYLLCF